MPGPTYKPADYEALVREVARQHGVDPDFAASIAEVESGFNPAARSHKDARGLMQIMPATGARHGVTDPAQLDDALTNITVGVKELKQLQDTYGNQLNLVARRYNASPKAPNEVTDYYVQQVFNRYRKRVGLPEAQPGEDTEGRIPRPMTAITPRKVAATGATGTTTPAATPAAAPEGAGFLRPTHAPTTPPAGLPTDRPPTLWERFRGQASSVPADVQNELDIFRATQTGATPPPRSPVPLISDEGYAHAVGLDPRHAEDRPGFGATVGGITGGLVGSLAGPWGTWGGRAAGAAVGGAAGQLYNEYFGPPPPPQAEPESGSVVNAPSATRRVLGAATEQGLFEVAPDVVVAPVKALTRSALESGISQAAKTALTSARQATTESFDQAINRLRTDLRDRGLRLKDQSAALTAQTRGQLKAAQQAGQTAVEPVQARLTAAEQALEQAREAARLNLRGVTRQGATEVRGARKAGQAGIEQARAVGQGARQVASSQYLGALPPTRPGQIAAGQQVLDVVSGEAAPVTLARRRLGGRVAEAAASGPMVDIRAAKQEAARVLTQELQPVARAFPAHDVPPLPPGATAGPGGPENLQIAEYLRGVRAKQAEKLQEQPALGIIERIINAPDEVPMGTLHQLYSDLGSAHAGVFEPGMKSKVEGLTEHLIGELRGALGSARHKPYERAAAEYKQLIDLFKRGNLDEIQQAAIRGPEKIVQMIDPDSPSQVSALMTMLRETSAQAKKSGSKRGREMGERAARAVQESWFYDNVLDGGIEGLTDRLAKLDAKPEFREALLGDPEYRQVLDNTRAFAQLWQTTVAQEAAGTAAAKTAKTTGVETAQERARQAMYRTQAQGEAAVKTAKGTVSAEEAALTQARERAAASVAQVSEQNQRLRDAQARRVRHERAGGQQQLQELRAQAKAAGAPSPEEAEFAASSLTPERLRVAKGGFVTTTRRILTAMVGMHALGPAGVGLILAEKGGSRAAEKDLLRWVVHSPEAVQFIVNNFAASQKPNWLAAQATRAGARAAGVTPSTLIPSKKKQDDKDKDKERP